MPDLNNARTDARGMAVKLKELGWSVILKQNASRRDISHSLADFKGRLKEGRGWAGVLCRARHSKRRY